MVKNIFSIDVEDWFHILDLKSTPDVSKWGELPSRVEANFLKLLDLLEEKNIKATCFFLGWVAERYPELVKKADRAGHEVASHGYSHQLVYSMSQGQFLEDVKKSKSILEDIVQKPVLGFRAPGFSITEKTPWAFDVLAQLGFQYDSSVFPANHGHGGFNTAQTEPHFVSSPSGDVFEFPISVTSFLRRRLCFSGGGYFRLIPYPIVKKIAQDMNALDRPFVFYIHPREIDPLQPRLEMGMIRQFKSYVNVDRTEGKIRSLLNDFSFTSFQDWMQNNSALKRESA
jgi:polysaccharide deacetylase family protein (PEP-CTERM system associated)